MKSFPTVHIKRHLFCSNFVEQFETLFSPAYSSSYLPSCAVLSGRMASQDLEEELRSQEGTRRQNVGFNAAWCETYGDSEHRVLRWLQLVSLANSSPSASDHSIMNMVQKEVAAQLRSVGVDRSRGGRSHPLGSRGGKGNRKLQLTGP